MRSPSSAPPDTPEVQPRLGCWLGLPVRFKLQAGMSLLLCGQDEHQDLMALLAQYEQARTPPNTICGTSGSHVTSFTH